MQQSETLNRILQPAEPLAFDRPVVDGGYQWWYLDASSADGQHHLVMIAFVGSVFSPFYARAVKRGKARAENYCAFNLGLYGPRGRTHWVFSEYLRSNVTREAHRFELKNNSLNWDGHELRITIDDCCAPIPRGVKGTIVARPQFLNPDELAIDSAAKHHWWPLAPASDIELQLQKPELSWTGKGYIDSNRGNVPLHHSFASWDWSRRHLNDQTHMTYNTLELGGHSTVLALSASATGLAAHPPEPELRLPPSGWRLPRSTRASSSRTVRTLDDTPFYARSLLTDADGALSMHESLSLTRFRSPWVLQLLPFRMRFPMQRRR